MVDVTNQRIERTKSGAHCAQLPTSLFMIIKLFQRDHRQVNVMLLKAE
jgi:hypothetical protein